eukprot:10710436-Lingulodinium_polyedra.AAC.1
MAHEPRQPRAGPGVARAAARLPTLAVPPAGLRPPVPGRVRAGVLLRPGLRRAEARRGGQE